MALTFSRNISFQGGWHFLQGGLAGCDGVQLDEGNTFDFGNYCEDELDLDADSAKVIMIEPGTECDGFLHYIVSPATWRDIVIGSNVKHGEYRYWHEASWFPCNTRWDSIRDWVAHCVEKLEEKAEQGETESNGDEDKEDKEQDSDGT